MANKLLTKSKYMAGLQCTTYLWLLFNEKESVPEFDMMTQHRMDQGNEVGQLAKQLFPMGIDVSDEEFMTNIRKTQMYIDKRKTIFEAGIMNNGLYSRADILVPVNKDEWDLIEVKSSTEVKDEHIQDCAFQKHVYIKSGLKIRKVFLLHVNKEFVKNGAIKPKDYLLKEEITDEVNEEIEGIEDRISNMLTIIKSKKKPKGGLLSPCGSPNCCPVPEECWGEIPCDSVFNLYRGGNKATKLYSNGHKLIKDIPKEENLTKNQLIQYECATCKKIHINKTALKDFLKTLKEPIYYMDFETYSLVIPKYDGMKPNQHIPFQFSIHKVEKGNSEHYSFLADSAKDPRVEFIEKLKSYLGTKGTIVVYNQSFEQSRLKELAEQFPKYKKWVESLDVRYVDLLMPFRNFDYYDPVQEGSASIKQVLPAVTGKSYTDLEIGNGGDASMLYYQMTLGKMSEDEMNKIRSNLEVYCGLDTEGMVWIVDKLKEIVK